MSPWKNLFLLLALALAGAARASESINCHSALIMSRPVVSMENHQPGALLNILQAEDIVGEGNISTQIQSALQFLANDSSANLDVKIKNLKTLFLAIRTAHLFTWEYDEYLASQKTLIFVDHEGQFVWIRNDGRIFYGKLNPDQDISRYGIWNGRASAMEEVKPQSL